MLLQTLKTLFERDLTKLKVEIALYKDEKNIWLIDKTISNSAGNLCLHIIGNLNAFIGAELGNTNYVRKRELEFAMKNVSNLDLLNSIDETINVVNNSLNALKEDELQGDYPKIVFEKSMSIEYFLVHLTTHLAYHLGQINYHRRLLDS